MFLHIGNNVLLRKDEVLGIFSIDSLMKDSKGRKFMGEVRKNKNYEDISEGKWASLVMTTDRIYISRISSMTLLGRADGDLKDMLSGAEAKLPNEDVHHEPAPEELEPPEEDAEDDADDDAGEDAEDDADDDAGEDAEDDAEYDAGEDAEDGD